MKVERLKVERLNVERFKVEKIVGRTFMNLEDNNNLFGVGSSVTGFNNILRFFGSLF